MLRNVMMVAEMAVFESTFLEVFDEIEKALKSLFHRRFITFLTLISYDL